jgi:outer membrane receptor protein involved in Fe transport
MVHKPGLHRWIASFALVSPGGGEALAQNVGSTPSDDIVVNRQHQPGEVEPLRHFNPEDLRAMGISSVGDLLRRLGAQLKGPDGANPVFAINRRRPLDDNEVQTLPFDAIQSFDLLPQEAAPSLGYPPSQPVLNFTTKAKFQSFEATSKGQTSTEGGGGMMDGTFGMTRIRGKSRLTLSASAVQHDALQQDMRSIRPDPAVTYDIVGNFTAIGGGEIDPRLSALANMPVTIAAVPLAPDARRTLAAYALGANRPNVTDLGPYRTLQPRQETAKLSGFFGRPISDRIMGMLSLSFERKRSSSLQGLATSEILLPSGNPNSPFGSDVLLNRYLKELPVLEQHGSSHTLHVGAGLVGSVSGWNWILRLNHDLARSRTDSDLGFDTSDMQQAVIAGGDAFSEITPSQVGPINRDRARSSQRTSDAQLVVNGSPVTLPAGPLTLTTTLNAQRSGTDSGSLTFPDADVALNRSLGGGSMTANIPIASAAYDVLPFIGRLSVEISRGVSTVSRHSPLRSGHLALVWTPVKRIQFLATLKHAESPPPLDQLGAPRIATPNVPFADLVTGESVFVTSISGGNPDLLPERRRTLTLTANIQPLKTDALRTSVIYEDVTIHDQSSFLSVLTPAIAGAFPNRFKLDGAGGLTSVDLSPVSLYCERQRTLKASLSYSGQLGHRREQPAEGQPAKAAYFYASLTPAVMLKDRLWLSPGTRPLDLLDGDSITAAGGRPRWDVQADLSLSRDGLGVSVQSVWHSGSRARNQAPAADIYFAALGTTALSFYSDLQQMLPNARWAKGLTVDATITNIANARPRVRNRLGETPIAYQPAYLDPLGRVVSMRLFKRF